MNISKYITKLIFLSVFIVIFCSYSSFTQEKESVLAKKLNEAIGPETSLLLWNLSKPDSKPIEFRADKPYRIASVIKVPILCAVLEKIQSSRGKATCPELVEGCLAPTLSTKIVVIREDAGIYSGANYLKTGESYTILQLIIDMITQSGNNSTNSLIRWLGGGDYERGEEAVNEWLLQNSFRNTCLKRKMGEFPYDKTPPGRENYSNCADIARLMKLIYEHKIIDYENSELILNLLKKSKKYEEIPVGIDDKSIVIANKVGEIPGYLHDAAIVFGRENNYILVILTKSPDNKSSYVAKLSKIIWDYYKKN